MFNRTLTAFGTILLVTLASACGSTSSPSDEAKVGVSVGGLTVVEMDEGAGKLVLRFEKDGRAIHFDMRLGPKMETPPSAEDLAADPSLPTYQSDVLVKDAAGGVFHMQLGGDSFIDPSWDTKPRIENFDEAGRTKDILSLRDAGEAFRQLKLPASLDQLRLAGIQIGKSVDQTFDKPGEAVKVPTAPSTGEGTLKPKYTAVNLASGASTVTKWDYKINTMCLFGCLGKHSAVHLRGWTASTTVASNFYSCNHGSCASAMSNECVMSGFRTDDGTHTRWFYSDTTTVNSSRNGACDTPYYWNSGPGGHNCNDDTTIQINAIYNDATQSRTTGVCSAAGSNYYPPACH